MNEKELFEFINEFKERLVKDFIDEKYEAFVEFCREEFYGWN